MNFIKTFDWWRPSVLFWIVLVFMLTLKTHRTNIGQGDEPHYVVIAESLLLDHDLDLTNNYESPRLKKFSSWDHHVARRPDRRQLPHHSIGLSLVGVPLLPIAYAVNAVTPKKLRSDPQNEMWIVTKNIFSFFMMVVAALGCGLFFRLFRQFFSDVRFCWVLALLLSLTPPVLSYGLLFFTDYPTAILVTLCVYRLVERRPFSWIDALVLAYLPLMHIRNYAVAAVLLAFYLQASKKSLLLAALTVGAWGATLLLNYSMWLGFTSERQPVQLKFFFTALPALFFDRSYGLFVFAPIYLIFPCGFALLYRDDKRLFARLVTLVVCLLAPVAGYFCWWGGWSPGPRYVTAAAPLLFLGVARCLTAMRQDPKLRTWGTAFIAGSFVLSALYWQRPKLLWSFEDGVNQFLTGWFGSVGRGIQYVLPNYFDVFPLPQGITFVWFMALMAANVALYKRLRNTRLA